MRGPLLLLPRPGGALGPCAPTEVVGEGVGGQLVDLRLDRAGHVRRALGSEAATAVLLQQGGEEPQRPGPVGEGVEHLEAHAAAVVDDAEQQGAAVGLVDRGAGVLGLRLEDGAEVAVLEVVPEHAAAQHRVVEREALVGRVQGLLQQRRVDLVVQLGGHAEDLGVDVAAGGEEDVRGVVQAHPVPSPDRQGELHGPCSRNSSITSYASFRGRAKRGRVITPCSASSRRWIRTRFPAAASARP